MVRIGWLRGSARLPGFVALLVLVGSCGGRGDAGAAGDAGGEGPAAEAGELVAPDACALLTREEVAEALAEPAGTPRPGLRPEPAEGTAAVMAACNYPAAGTTKSIAVTAWRANNGMYTSDALDGARRSLQESTGQPPEEIAGLGEVAFWGGGQLHVVKDGNNYFIVAPAAFGDDASARAAAMTAARRILRAL